MRARVVAVVVVLLAAALWLLLPATKNEAPRTDVPGDAPEEAGVANRPPRPTPPEPSAAPAAPAPGATAPPVPTDDVVGPRPEDPHEPWMVPHPLTPEHQRIQAENELVQALNDAMANRDTKLMRKLVADYRALDPTDRDASQRGYGLIADCIDSGSSPASLDAAHRFYDAERQSTLRRYVRRICFERGN